MELVAGGSLLSGFASNATDEKASAVSRKARFKRPSFSRPTGRRKRLSRTPIMLALLVVLSASGSRFALADVSVSSLGMGHGAASAEAFAQFENVIQKYNASGERFRIDTYCPSACTMFLSIRNACIAPRAILAFHAGGSMKKGLFVPSRTQQMLATYNSALRQYLIDNHLMDTFAFHKITGKELVAHFGYMKCQ